MERPLGIRRVWSAAEHRGLHDERHGAPGGAKLPSFLSHAPGSRIALQTGQVGPGGL